MEKNFSECIEKVINGEKKYKTREVANILDLNVQTVRRYLREGRIDYFSCSGIKMVLESDLIKFTNKK